jgi:beta-glucosidase
MIPNLLTVTPAPNLSADETGEYNWLERHEQVKQENAKGPVDLIFIGDSIMHYFGGKPTAKYVRGGDIWERYYGRRHTVNMGFGRDRTQNVLWRFEHGALDGVSPRLAVTLIGVNNILAGDTPEDIARGIKTVCATLRDKLPATKILLLGLLPFSHDPNDPCRLNIKKVNELTAKPDRESHIYFLDIGNQFLSSDGAISPEIMPDGLHPNSNGYQIFANAIEPEISYLLNDNSI